MGAVRQILLRNENRRQRYRGHVFRDLYKAEIADVRGTLNIVRFNHGTEEAA